MNFKKLVILTNMPSPYQVDFFNGLSREIEVLVVYIKKTEPGRTWNYENRINHEHVFLRDSHYQKFNRLKQVLNNKNSVFIISGYNLPEFVYAMSYLTLKNTPWIFWGEKLRLKKLWVKKFTVIKLLKHARIILGMGEVASRIYHEITGVPSFNFPYHIDTSRFKRNISQPESTINFFYSGQLIMRKGIMDIIDAFEMVRNEYGDRLKLHIIGDGPLLKTIKQRISSYRKQIELHGFIRYENLHKIYRMGHVFLFPSLYDGWGVALAEGMASGMVPISTFTTGAATDLILHEYNGYIIPPNQPGIMAHYMKKLIENPILVKKMGKRAAIYTQEKNDIKFGVDKILQILSFISF